MSELERLTGKKLKQKLKELNDEVLSISAEEMAKGCGYYEVTDGNEVHVNLIDFYIAVLNIKNDSD